MTITKGALGRGYVGAAGAALSAALLGHAYVAMEDSVGAALVALVGLIPAAGLIGAHVWLRDSGLEGHQLWTVARWTGVGIGALTLLAVGLSAVASPTDALAPALLASAVAFGGAVGLLVGTMLELRRNARRLSQSNDVLHRLLRHDVRNDLNVVLGHLGELESGAVGPAAARIDRMRAKVDDIVETVEKARHVDLALSAANRSRRPVDVVPWIEETVAAATADRPSVSVDLDLPEHAWVRGDWLIGTVLENLVENALENGSGSVRSNAPGTPGTATADRDERRLRISVSRVGETVLIRVVDDGPPIPDNERVAFAGDDEEPLRHGTGVGPWLVRWIVESYGGDLVLERADDGGNAVLVELPAARDPDRRSVPDRVRAVAGRRPRSGESDPGAAAGQR